MKWLLCTKLALGILLFCHLVSFQLVVVGFTQLRLVLMVRLIALRLAWLLKDILRFMVLIMVTHSPSLPRLLLSVSFSPWLLCVSGHFISWILKKSSFMVILPRKFIWSNHLVLLLRGSLVQGQKNRFFRPIFRRKIGFRWCWKRFSGGKIVCKKIGKKSGKIADFSPKSDIFPKNPIFPEIWGKLYFRSLRGEKLKNGAKQSCRIKKKCIFGKNNSCLVR